MSIVEDGELTHGLRNRMSLADNLTFGQSGKPTLEFLLQAKDYIDRLVNSTGRDYLQVAEDVVRSVYSYKTLRFKKDHRFWLYKNKTFPRQDLTNEELGLMEDIHELNRSLVKEEELSNPSDTDSEASNQSLNGDDRLVASGEQAGEELSGGKVAPATPRAFSLRDGCPIHRKDCRTWRYKTLNRADCTQDTICEWYKKYTRWKAVVRGKRTRFSSVNNPKPEDGPRPAMKSATVVDYTDNTLLSPRELESHFNDGIGAPLNKKSAAYCVGMQPNSDWASSDEDQEFPVEKRLNNSKTSFEESNGAEPILNETVDRSSDGSQSSGSETNLRLLQEVERADELLAMQMYQAELNANNEEQENAIQTNGLEIQEVPMDEQENLNSNQHMQIGDASSEEEEYWLSTDPQP